MTTTSILIQSMNLWSSSRLIWTLNWLPQSTFAGEIGIGVRRLATRDRTKVFFIIIYLQFLDGLKVSNNERRCSRDASSRFRPNMASRALCRHFRLFVFSVSAGDLHIHKSIALVSKADSRNFLKTRKVSVLLDDGGNLGIHCRMNKFLFVSSRSYPIAPRRSLLADDFRSEFITGCDTVSGNEKRFGIPRSVVIVGCTGRLCVSRWARVDSRSWVAFRIRFSSGAAGWREENRQKYE